MGDVSLSGKLPRGDANGLGPIARDLIRDPKKVQALILLVDCSKIITEVETDETIPLIRIRRVEAIRKEDLAGAQQLIRRAWEQRAGDTVLPIELEDDLDAIFHDFNPDTTDTDTEQPTKPDDKDGETSE